MRHAWIRMGTTAAAMVIVASACGSTSPGGGGVPANQPPTASMKLPTTVGAGEGQLNLIGWEGYVDKSWTDTFTQMSGCKVNAKYAGSSDEMVTLMANGGGGQGDMVSASGDADLRLIYSGDVQPMNPPLIPDYGNFQPQFKSPGFNTINGIHYGISLQWGPNVLLYNTTKFPIAPTSWSVIYDKTYTGV